MKENNFKIIDKKTIENTVKNITSNQILHSKKNIKKEYFQMSKIIIKLYIVKILMKINQN